MSGGGRDEHGVESERVIRDLRLRVAVLESENSALAAARDTAIAERRAVDERCAELNEQVQFLLRRIYGRKSEKDSGHPLLPYEFDDEAPPPPPPVEALEAPDDESTSEAPKARRKKRARRATAQLPTERVELTLPEDERRCGECSQPMAKIGEDVTERYDYRPAIVVARQFARAKYACRCCQNGIKIAPAQPAVIEKGNAEPGLLAQVVVAKYADHLPLYRQHTIFARHGIDLPKSTMCDYVADVAELAKPIVKELTRGILAGPVIHSDDTGVLVQDKAVEGGSRKAFLWAYVGEHGDVVFDFTRSRSREGPKAFLGKYLGYLQADAYAGYDEVYSNGLVTEVACWAHVRRKFFDAEKLGSDVGGQVVQMIRALYVVERDAKERGLDAEQTRALRQERSKPVLDKAHPWLAAEAKRVLPKSILGKAFTYCLKLWPALVRYLDDGRLDIDNNVAERAMRMVAVGRKNWLFAGSDAGGERAAILYSLIVTCRSCGVDPWTYLRDVLPRLATTPQSRIAELTPRGWKAARDAAQAVQATAS